MLPTSRRRQRWRRTSKTDEDDGIKIICRNKRAFHEYEVHDTLECGVALTGTEVKSLRDGLSSLEEAYAKLDGGEVWLIGSDIPEYAMGNRMNHKPKRPRKLLMHRREIDKFAGKASQQGFTLVPLRMYFKNGIAKVELAVVPRQAVPRQARGEEESGGAARDQAGNVPTPPLTIGEPPTIGEPRAPRVSGGSQFSQTHSPR